MIAVRNFWKRIKNLVKSRGLTQEQLAKECKIYLNTLKGWMSKNYWPPVHYAARIGRYLGVSVEYLVYGKETDPALQLENVYKLLTNIEVHLKKE